MTVSEPFIDYYKLLGVDWDCDTRTLEYAYRQLAKQYHPDHPETVDVIKFNEVIAAYRALRDPDDRAAYDHLHATNGGDRRRKKSQSGEAEAEEKAALNDAEVHEKVLRLLYKKRRELAKDAGVPQFSIQEMLGCSDSAFEFHMWYLKAKGFVSGTEQGTLAITIEGVDEVISMSRTKRAEQLRLSRTEDSQE